MALKISTQGNQVVFTDTVTSRSTMYNSAMVEARYISTGVHFIHDLGLDRVKAFNDIPYDTVYPFADIQNSLGVSLVDYAGVSAYLSNILGNSSTQKDFLIEVARGNIYGYSLVNKLGQNSDVDALTLPEDVWSLGGMYTGFPTGAPETVSCVSTNVGDTGVLTITGLLTSSSTEYIQESITLTGTTPKLSVNSYYRIHSAQYSSGTPTGLNLGVITVGHSTTTANVFLSIEIGRSQSNVGAYTVPFGSTAYMINFFANVKDGGTSVDAEVAMWVRSLGGSPRLRRPISVSSVYFVDNIVKASIDFAGGTDIIPRVYATSNSNLSIQVGYDLLIIKD